MSSVWSNADIIRVTAAAAGISSTRWDGIRESEATDEQALAKMKECRYDVLPILHGDGEDLQVRQCFVALRWNDYSCVQRQTITHRDVIPASTSVRDVIRAFALESRLFYFLSVEDQIAGLVSVANLNSREVLVYLFGMLSKLEVALASLISSGMSRDEIVKTYDRVADPAIKDKVFARYQVDKQAGVDLDFLEYVNFRDLVQIACKGKLYETIGYEKKQFTVGFGDLAELRNNIAHPVKSLIGSSNGVNQLWERIDRLEEALFRLQPVSQDDVARRSVRKMNS
jgi:hypothetical protein